MSGVLYIVATPIGNRDDITYRAVDVLKSTDVIAAEDTRHSKKLLDYWGIANKRMIPLYEYNEQHQLSKIEQLLKSGLSVALISDAGTPLINDPGYRLVSYLQNAGCRIETIPGPCALVAALSIAGLPTDRFQFEGFLPAKHNARKERLETVKDAEVTLVFYEAPHRLMESLQTMSDVFGSNRQAAVARELTKHFESVRRDTINNLLSWFKSHPESQRGELVILVEGSEPDGSDHQFEHHQKIVSTLIKELPLSQAVKLARKLTGRSRNQLYQWALAMRDDQ